MVNNTIYEPLDEPIIDEEDNFKMNCYVIEDTVIDCRNRSFELCANHESAFGFLYFIHKLQEMPEETLKHDHGNLLLK